MYKLMIADDEIIECRALEHMLQDISDELEILPSVYDGISLIKGIEKYKPHIVIIDINMPGLNGLEVIELLKMKKISARIIVNTAYSDFSYVQKALKMGVSDYLLKPHSEEELAESVKRVIDALDEEYKGKHEWEKSRMAADLLWQVASEKWLLSILIGEPDEKCYQVLCSSFPEIKQGGGFVAWQMDQNEDLIQLKMAKTTEYILEQMKKFCHCIGMEYKECFYMFVMTGNQEKYESTVTETAEYICGSLQKKQIFIKVGIGTYQKNKEQFYTSMKEAKIAMQSREGAGISYFSYESKQSIPDFFEGEAARSAQLLQNGKQKTCIQLLQESIVKKWNEAEYKEAIKIQMVDYMLTLEAQLKHITGKEGIENPLPWTAISRAAEAETLAKISENWILELSYCYFKKVNSGNLYVEKALLYIYENYSQDISLEKTAEAIGITSFYLSRLIKQEKKQTFLEILTEVRIQKAISLIKEGNLLMKDICQSVGYSNMTYFYKVFKKMTGFTVGMARKYLPQI